MAKPFGGFGKFEGLKLNRVLIGPDQADLEVRVLAVELYEDGLIVRFALLGGLNMPETPEEAALRPQGPMNFGVADDLGTQYMSAGSHSGGGKVTRGDAQFIPAVPEGASRLTVLTDAGPIDSPLT